MVAAEALVDRIVKHLRESGYRASSRRAGACYIVSVQREERVYVISISRGSMVDVYVAKVTLPELLPGPEWSCEAVEYSPYGYYVLEEEPEKVVSAILRKLEALDRVYRGSG